MSMKVAFSSDVSGSITIDSCWKTEKEGLQKEFSCQTSPELFEFAESGTQTALSNDIGTEMIKVINNKIETTAFFILKFDLTYL